MANGERTRMECALPRNKTLPSLHPIQERHINNSQPDSNLSNTEEEGWPDTGSGDSDQESHPFPVQRSGDSRDGLKP